MIKKPLKIYICGKMTGVDNYNYPKFNAVAKTIKADGHIPVNPAAIKGSDHWEWSDYMKAAIKQMVDCDMVFVLDGYETSAGALIEIDLATKLGIDVKYETNGGLY